MKTRILSFLLVLVMLFSCLSLNIFAADGAQADLNGEEATATPMTADELKALCQANGIGLDGKVNLDKDAIAGLSSDMLYLIANSNVDDDTDSLALGVGKRTHNAVRKVIFIDVDGDSGKTIGEGDVQLYVWEDIEKVEEDGNFFYRWANKIYWDEACTDPCDFSFTEDAEGNKTFNDERLQQYVDGKSKLVLYPLGSAAYIDTKEPFSPDVISELTTSKNNVITNVISPVNEDPEKYEASIWNGYVTNSYIQAAYTYYTINGSKKYINNQAGYEAIRDEGLLGASYAVTFDVRHREGIKTGAIFNTLRSYITKECLTSGSTADTYVVAGTPVSINADGSLIANGQDTQFDLKPETWYQLTVYHTPRGLDGIKGTSDDNTFHVFADGKLVATNLEVKFEKGKKSSLDNADFEYNGEKLNIYTDFLLGSIRIGQTVKTGVDIDDFRLYYGSPLECAHKWEYSHKHDLEKYCNVLVAECEWCGKTETANVSYFNNYGLSKDDIGEKASEIIANSDVDSDTTTSALGLSKITLSGAQLSLFIDVGDDWTRTDVNGDGKTNATDDVAHSDDVQLYVKEEIETVTENGDSFYRWANKIYWDEEYQLPCDFSYTEDAEGNKTFNDEKLQNLANGTNKLVFKPYNSANAVKTNEPFSPDVLSKITTTAGKVYKNIIVPAGEGKASIWNGYVTNVYMNKSFTTVKGTDGTNLIVKAENYDAIKEAEQFGAPYAITFDLRHHDGVATGAIFNTFRSYVTQATFGSTTASPSHTATTPSVYISADGYLCTNSGTTDYQFTSTDWYQLTFYHTPRGLDDIKGTDDDSTYHILIDGKLVITDKMPTISGLNPEITVHNGEKLDYYADFILSFVRFGQGMKTGLDVDNFRLYRGKLLECAHTDNDGNLTIKDGACTTCKAEIESKYACNICARDTECSAHAISPEVAVAKRNLTLTDSIDMNLYLELSDAIRANADAKIVLEGADGAREAEYALADLTAEANGTYKVTLPLRSIDMTRKVTAAVYAGDEKISATYTTTVADYLMAVYNASEKDYEKALIEATLNYGAYAQKYFAVKNGNAALDHLLPNGKVTDNVVESTAPVASKEASATINNIELTDVSLILTSTTKIKIYFTAPEGVVPTSDTGVISKESGENEYSVILDGVMPKKLDEQSTVTITAAGEENTVSISVYNCLEAIAGTTDANYVNLAKALYLFGEVAKNYPAQ